MKRILSHLKKIWNLPTEVLRLWEAYRYLTKTVNERTEVHADVHMREPSVIIAIGRYNGRDYVRAYTLDVSNWNDLIQHLNEHHKYAKVGRFDMIPGMDIRAVYPRERF